MANLFHLTMLEIILLVFVFRCFISIISSIVIFVIPLVNGSTSTDLSNKFKCSSKFKRLGVRFLFSDIETLITIMLSIMILFSFFIVHSHYTNISLVTSSILLVVVDAYLYYGLKREKILTGATY